MITGRSWWVGEVKEEKISLKINDRLDLIQQFSISDIYNVSEAG